MIAPTWASVEFIEAAVRSGKNDIAAEALRRRAEITSAGGTEWALLSDGDTAEHLYGESIERPSRTRVRVELARTWSTARPRSPGWPANRPVPPTQGLHQARQRIAQPARSCPARLILPTANRTVQRP
jgi:hypothetical protein